MVTEALARLGGVARRSELVAAASRAALDRALHDGTVVRIARGVYALPQVEDGRRAAVGLRGALSHQSAALAHGWAVAHLPDRHHVTVRRDRRIRHLTGAHVHWAEVTGAELRAGVTTPDRTLADCLRVPFPEALAIADLALRSGATHSRLLAVAQGLRGPGSREARRVAALASPLAANPFESVLRALAVEA